MSSSDEEDGRAATLFSGLAASKRRKRDPNGEDDARKRDPNGEDDTRKKGGTTDMSGNHNGVVSGKKRNGKSPENEHQCVHSGVFEFKSPDKTTPKTGRFRSGAKNSANGLISQPSSGLQRVGRDSETNELDHLLEIFPQHTKEHLDQVLKQSGNLSEAIAELVSGE